MLLPELICREVLASVYLAGGTVAFYPVSQDLSPSCTADDMAEAKAIVAVNYFGFPQDLVVFRRYCQRTGAALIEDNAHGLFSRDTHGELLGSRGDAGVFSFRKTIAVPDGGALVLTDGRTQQTEHLSEVKVSGVEARYRVKQFLRPAVRSLGPIRTRKAVDAMRQIRRLFTGRTVPVSADDAEVRIPVAPNPSALITRAINVAEPDSEIERRRALYDLAGRLVAGSDAAPVFPRLPPNVAPYGFPILATPSQADRLADDVSRCGLQLSHWPDLPEAIGSSGPSHYHNLMVLPFLW